MSRARETAKIGSIHRFRAPASPAQSLVWGDAGRSGADGAATTVERGAKPPFESASKIRFDDTLVGLNQTGRPLGDLLAVVEHEDGLAQPHDHLHVVLHQENGAP